MSHHVDRTIGEVETRGGDVIYPAEQRPEILGDQRADCDVAGDQHDALRREQRAGEVVREILLCAEDAHVELTQRTSTTAPRLVFVDKHGKRKLSGGRPECRR